VSTLRVVTLNAGSLFEPDWPGRRAEQVAWLDELDADVVCLQEVWQDDATPCSTEWLVDHTAADWHWTFGGFPFPPELGSKPDLLFGSAILSRWPIEHEELIPLPVDHGEVPDPFWRLQLELLHVVTAGVHVFSTHLAPPPAQAYHRRRQVLAIDDAVRAAVDARPSTMVPILCGDFNAEPDSDEIRFLTSLATIGGRSTYLQDAWRVTAHTDPGFTGDPRTNPLCASFNVPPKRLDYVFVGDPWGKHGAGVVARAELAFHEARTGVLASDHYGLVVDVAWPAMPDRPEPN
jgi:endonuclease/exonuclease/phosphatase family metal-dependent hydrolase